ncbi:MAG: biotin carboxylase N-terminal domain-containing protein, partial [Actinomycetota bacterium]|nr:biotin carboxylase N-terminal domain-containing protein [Actinomycetota bacterium]
MATRQIRRLLIANRGEIAIRIARTARDRGISCVGVYSDADSTSLHLDSMDAAVALGGETAAESYLRIDAIVEAAVANGCDAVHPGYGFLAENAEAARAVEAAGLMWVGPTAEQIELLGDKVAAKRAAEEAGVPTTPIIEVAADGSAPADVSMPALVKAAAGGGGRGMRIVREGDDLAAAIESASREAAAAFGDATVFIEPYIEQGRHIEVQIVGDGEGEVLHFGERDCSVQRRNQKVIEEAPAVGLPDDVRAALHDGATRLARHVNYRGAGTVEFLVGNDGTITFLEVNTRLQVEHPVTEAVTDVDLVGLQFDVASGVGLEMTQEAISLSGHAVELRLVAEDPSSGWMPSTGVITAFDVPGNVRVDSGIRPGSVVTTNYDSLLAKIIVTGADRRTALAVAADAMRRADIGGVRTNADSLVAILTDDVFAEGGVDTGYLDRQPHVLQGVRPETADIDAHLVAVVLDRVAA